MEMVRQERVQESLAIYRSQLAEKQRIKETMEKLNAEDRFLSEQNRRTDTFASYYDNPSFIATTKGQNENSNCLRWSEAMDMTLARLVAKMDFDFDQIALCIKEDARFEADEILDCINAEECRLRWSFLDSENWTSEGPENGNGMVEAKVEYAPQTISEERLAQLKYMTQFSFEELQSQSAGFESKYLKRPETLPSMQVDESDDDDEYGAEEGHIAVLSRKEIERGAMKKALKHIQSDRKLTNIDDSAKQSTDFEQLD